MILDGTLTNYMQLVETTFNVAVTFFFPTTFFTLPEAFNH